MRLIFHIFVAMLLTACASTKTAVQTERTEQVQTEREEQRIEHVQTERTEQTERVKITVVEEEIVEQSAPIVADTSKVVEPAPIAPAVTTKTTKRTTRTVEGEKKAVEELTETATSEQVEQIEERVAEETSDTAIEVEDSTPKNLRWLGIIALCVFGIYLLTFIKKFIK